MAGGQLLDILSNLSGAEQLTLITALDNYSRNNNGLASTAYAAAQAAASTLAQSKHISASYTLTAADSGSILISDANAAITVTVPKTLPANFNCTILQNGTGQVTVAAGAGAVVNNRSGYTKTAGQDAWLTLLVKSNADGNTAIVSMTGDGQ